MNENAFQDVLNREGLVVFTARDAARLTGKPLAYARVFLSRLARRGRVKRVAGGKYCTREATAFEVASNLVFPSYVSFLSALAFHGLTTQIPVVVQVACRRQRASASFGNTRIAFVRLKPKAFFGYRRYGNAFVAEPEKAIVDGLYLPRELPVSDTAQALQRQALDVKKLCAYAERLGSPVVIRRLGFLLDRLGISHGLKPAGALTKYAPLNPTRPRAGEKNRTWMLVVNEVLE